MKPVLYTKTSLEGELYRLMCLISTVLCFVTVVSNSLLGFSYLLNLIVGFFGILFLLLYADFSKKGVTRTSLTLLTILMFVIISIAWFFSNGLVGGMISIYSLFQMILLLITRAKYLKYTMVVIVVHFSSLFLAQNFFKEYVVPYASVEAQELDTYISSIIVLCISGYAIWKFRSIYETERNLLKESLLIQERAKQEAERYNNLQSDFLANMSHEIRTPLNGIIGNTEFLSNLKKDEDPTEYINSIAQSSQMLLSLINNVLDLSKLESNKLELQTTPFSLKTLLKQVESIFLSTVKKKGLNLIFEVDNSLPDFFIGDSNQLKQVLVNLISNAIKFTTYGGVTVTLSGKKVKQHVELYIEVADTGIGISEEQQAQIFSRFYQVQQALNRSYQGSGLGLIISKNLVELMGGAMWIESTLGHGSIFSFSLCLPQAENQAISTTIELEDKLPELTILVAEDNEINQKLLKKQLLGFGFEATVVANGKEVLEAISQTNYDLIFMDVQMPVLDGISTTQKIRLNQTIQQPIIIALTANALKDDKIKCLTAGMNDYLSKPISLLDMKKALLKWFGESKADTPEA